LRRGMPREELKSRLKISAPRLFTALLRRWMTEGLLSERGGIVWRTGHEIRFTPQQKAQVERLLTKFAKNPFSPPSVKEAQAEAGEDLFAALVDMGELTLVSPDVVFRKSDYERMMAMVQQHFEREESLTAAQFRDQLNTSRRYVLAFLEHLDAIGVTVREGDARKLRKGPHNRAA
jgi:selenocysteine-specific elongation factor